VSFSTPSVHSRRIIQPIAAGLYGFTVGCVGASDDAIAGNAKDKTKPTEVSNFFIRSTNLLVYESRL